LVNERTISKTTQSIARTIRSASMVSIELFLFLIAEYYGATIGLKRLQSTTKIEEIYQ